SRLRRSWTTANSPSRGRLPVRGTARAVPRIFCSGKLFGFLDLQNLVLLLRCSAQVGAVQGFGNRSSFVSLLLNLLAGPVRSLLRPRHRLTFPFSHQRVGHPFGRHT